MLFGKKQKYNLAMVQKVDLELSGFASRVLCEKTNAKKKKLFFLNGRNDFFFNRYTHTHTHTFEFILFLATMQPFSSRSSNVYQRFIHFSRLLSIFLVTQCNNNHKKIFRFSFSLSHSLNITLA